MKCRRCRKKFEEFETRCPHCGETNDHAAGMFQTSSVLISTSGTERVYRSVDEVPAALRTRLLKSTNGANSATILIADVRGRREIAKAMRNLPGPAQRRWMQAITGTEASSSSMGWLTPSRRRAILAVVTLLTTATIALLFANFR
jgi:predicted amidophosphoribosyltransferase